MVTFDRAPSRVNITVRVDEQMVERIDELVVDHDSDRAHVVRALIAAGLDLHDHQTSRSRGKRR